MTISIEKRKRQFIIVNSDQSDWQLYRVLFIKAESMEEVHERFKNIVKNEKYSITIYEVVDGKVFTG